MPKYINPIEVKDLFKIAKIGTALLIWRNANRNIEYIVRAYIHSLILQQGYLFY
ncbi:hypothetical protein ETAE_1029 [Edwardsiella piscicida]|uniref:Uncharacterized protein n=1 Tax=Edwardsiella piscicida TaxID=1263550 RepID=A0AAU8PEU3_EDWPI|nr:hypothetical protein ETAE_1029 [Edwardsiella tarda EIB202]